MSVLVSRSSSFARRSAFTIIEMLIGMAITLVMMAAVVNLFANIGAGVKIRRATMEMSGELRMMRATLFNDLAGATCKALPWARPDEDQGYLEIIEGFYEDTWPSSLTDGNAGNGELNFATSQVPSSQNPVAGSVTDARGLGDFDDILALTVRSEGAPFKGRAGNTTIESNLAEVVWYAVENPADDSLGEPGMRTVYRRVLLVAPWFEIPATAPTAPLDFFRQYDISARYDSNLMKWVPNSLGDLTKRENRFAHYYDTSANRGFPHRLVDDAIRKSSYASPAVPVDGPLRPFGAIFEGAGVVPDRQGEDVMLSNVLAFDLRVFDPGAPIFSYGGTVIEPAADPIFNPAVQAAISGPPAGALIGFGAYVDLGWDNSSSAGANIPDYNPNDFSAANPGMPLPLFQQERQVGWHPREPNSYRANPCVYDTWSFHYENDGIDQDVGNDNGAGIDQGTNGLDDSVPYPDPPSPDARDGVDDVLERETSPPYPVPLRGLQVKLRIYEPETRQIREATVTKNFVQP